MNKVEQLDYLIKELINENETYKEIEIPEEYKEKRKLLRGLIKY